MKENLKKFAVWLLAVAAVMAFYTYSYQREHNRYAVTSSFQGVVLEVYPEEDRVVVEEVSEKEGSSLRKHSVPTEDAEKFQIGDAVLVKQLDRVDLRHTGTGGQKVEIEKTK